MKKILLLALLFTAISANKLQAQQDFTEAFGKESGETVKIITKRFMY